MYYIQARCFRDFKGLNVLAKKEVRVVKNLEYQVKLMEAGRLDIEIVNGRLAEGNLQTPQGLDKTLVEIKKTYLAAKFNIENEEKKIAKAKQLLESIRSKVIRYETIAGVKKK
jgi:C4-type Zn-finger protein